MAATLEPFVQKIHDAPGRVVLAIAGGGSRAIADLLEVAGASRTVLEALVPYCEASAVHYLGAAPERFCSAPTARAMAIVAFGRARQCGATDETAGGVASTSGLATDRPKRGAHRAHVALQTAARTASWSLELQKDRRSRAEEEQIVAQMILNAVAAGCGVADQLDLPLAAAEQVEHLETVAPPPWRDLLLGKTEVVRAAPIEPSTAAAQDSPLPRAVLPGAFNPLHAGHLRMAQVGQQFLGLPVAMEISILNVDKPPLDYFEMERRLGQFPAEQAVWLTRAATFERKSESFPGATFLVGIDTLERIAAVRYYRGDSSDCLRALERIAARGCRFLVFGRDTGTGFVRLSDLDLPGVLREICREVPEDQFREDVSSTALRRSEAW